MPCCARIPSVGTKARLPPSENQAVHVVPKPQGVAAPRSIPRIAASNIEIEKTGVSATTLHNMFELDGEYKTKLDFGKTASPKVAELIALEVLLLDEVSMVDELYFEGIQNICSIIDHSRRNGADSVGGRAALLAI